MLNFGSVCSGIEAVSVAWDGLGWHAVWFAEIERFPAAVLAHRYPDVPNLGDMTKISAAVRAGTVTAPAILVGGTPCQAFSIAGLRKSLDDPRGQLTLAYVDLANAIDETRKINGEYPAVHVWENVPGSLYTPDNAFGHFLAAMAGENEPFEPGERPVHGKSSKFWRWNKVTSQHIAKWPKSGCVIGRQRRLAWRILDAQYFGVPQRRRRVFVVASARNDVDPAEVLFEFEGVRRNSPPGREAWQAVAPLTASGVGVGGPDFAHAAAGHLISAFGGGNCSGALDVAACLTAKGQRNDFDVETFAVQSATGDITHTLTAEGHDASEDGTGRGTPVVAIHGTQDPDVLVDTAHTLGCNQGQENALLTYGFQTRIARNGRGDMGDLCHTLSAEAGETGKGDSAPCVAQLGGSATVRRLTPKECERLQGFPDGWTLIPEKKRNELAADELAYLRLLHPDMPEEEAHRLAADGPRYKAIGNSMAVPVMRWIGDRIANQIMVVAERPSAPPASAMATVLTATRRPAAKKKRAPAADVFTRPFLKWAGGKYSVLDVICESLPAGKRLIEPFVGGGSVFQNAGFQRNLLGDVNPDLINLYNQMQHSPEAVIKTSQALVTGCISNAAYLAIRNEFNARQAHAVRHAALFLALMRTCFNAVCRYNKRGEFNVGWNKKGGNNYFPAEELRSFAARQANNEFVCSGFKEVIGRAMEGDVIFCDPPYEPMPEKEGFTNYSGTAFTFDDQIKLVECLVAARQRGARVVITNSSAPLILQLYIRNGFRIAPLPARRSVSCKSETRQTVNDIIAIL
ncbi:Dam family site-specific DNA-(adenine-N6)-methyltransferase [Pantoea agglomerans]|uniref:Dam family site-specific DNA-(adenine-N6)-methyltransferase n=1 Tax=Enterobacter agglomerans TaxID=549 RepID=UPI003C79A7ED